MNDVLAFLVAQIHTVDVSPASLLVVYGPMGVILAWFMLRFEKMIEEMRRLSHRIDGITRAMMVDVLSRPSTGDQARKFAEEMLEKADARSESRTGNPFRRRY